MLDLRDISARSTRAWRWILGVPPGTDESLFQAVPLENLRALLTADARAQRLRASRLTVLHLLALTGGLCWVLMNWPLVLPSLWRLVARVGWPLCLALLLVFGLLERRSSLVRLTRR